MREIHAGAGLREGWSQRGHVIELVMPDTSNPVEVSLRD